MTISDTLIILATLFSPLIAVQSQKWIQQATSRHSAKIKIFYDLMATHATRVAHEHVQALNKIDLEFSAPKWGLQNALDKEVINRWRIYADHLNTQVDETNQAAVTAWLNKQDELFLDLLDALSRALNYNFDRVQLKRGIYFPRAHGQAEQRRELFEQALIKVLTGGQPISMKVTEFPFSDEAADLQTKVHEAFLSAVDSDGAIKVKRPT